MPFLPIPPPLPYFLGVNSIRISVKVLLLCWWTWLFIFVVNDFTSLVTVSVITWFTFFFFTFFIVVQVQLCPFHFPLPPTPAIPISNPWSYNPLVVSMCPLYIFLKPLHTPPPIILSQLLSDYCQLVLNFNVSGYILLAWKTLTFQIEQNIWIDTSSKKICG